MFFSALYSKISVRYNYPKKWKTIPNLLYRQFDWTMLILQYE